MLLSIKDFKSDPTVRGAAPDVVLRDEAVDNLAQAVNIRQLTNDSEILDWGVGDIEANNVWELPGADNGVIFGVMDVGFASHEDIIFSSISSDMNADDHGNHVAGIACAQNNGKGIRGVIPNCFVRPKAGNFHASEPGGNILAFVQTFGQILAALNEFIPNKDEVKTFNISLGYNWISNFGINPDTESSEQWRQIVAAQGEIFVSVLSLAAQKNKVVFSAAGNDSGGLADPIDAKFASPMNWAAITARERNIVSNGVVVEAHDQAGNRANFSNEKGHLSCPGVNILSAVAHDSSGAISQNQYAEMSGTSMASPYCAAGHTLFSLVRPNYLGVEVVDCFIESGVASSSGSPMLKLDRALSHCPPKS